MKKIAIVFALVLGMSWSCSDRDDNILAPNIRIQNSSNLNFTRVEVRTDTIFFENVAAASFSPYLELNPAYEQDTIRVETDSLSLRFVPDALGTELPNGLYTYQLNINEAGELVFTFKVD